MTRLDALLAYQQTQLEKEGAENAVRSTPSRVRLNKLHKLLKGQQATIARLAEELEARMAQVKRLADRTEQLEKQLSLETGELDTIRQDEESTAEEMTELRVDIEKLNRDMVAASREAKTLLTEMEAAVTEYQNTRQTAGKAKREYDQLRAVCEQERADSASELEAFDAKLAAIEKEIEPAMMQRYRRARQHHNVPVVKVENGKCSGCNMSLPMAMLKRLATPGTILECENCGRLLYAELP